MCIRDSYYLQMNLCLEITKRAWCDFISWAPEGYVIFRVHRDNDLHEQLLPHYLKFFAAMQRMANAPPVLSDDDNTFIKTVVADSMERCIDMKFWANVDPSAVPPSPERGEEEDEEDDLDAEYEIVVKRAKLRVM